VVKRGRSSYNTICEIRIIRVASPFPAFSDSALSPYRADRALDRCAPRSRLEPAAHRRFASELPSCLTHALIGLGARVGLVVDSGPSTSRFKAEEKGTQLI
jgi:hypothetical protein